MRKFTTFVIITILLIGCSREHTDKCQLTSSTLSSMYITIQPNKLDSIFVNKNIKASAQALLISFDNDTLYNGDLTYIKSRGNSTFAKDKKPFTIKFPSKQSLFGLDRNKSFVLLANAMDDSHIRNAIAFDIAHLLGLPAPKYTYLSLYINDEYKGLYQLTNKIDVGMHTLHIGKSGGYLLELGQNNNKKIDNGFVSSNGEMIYVKYPKNASAEELEYIECLYDTMIEAIKPSSGKDLTDYIDIRSFTLYYLLQETLQNVDGCITSFYMYKHQWDSLFYAGPVWDFDLSINNVCSYGIFFSPYELSVRRWPGELSPDADLLFNRLKHNPQFQKYIVDAYINTFSPIVHEYLESGKIDELVSWIYYDIEQDERINHNRIDYSYDDALAKVTNFLEQRIEFLDWYYQTDTSEMICITDETDVYNPRYYYIPVGGRFILPEPFYVGGFYNNSPVATWYYVDSNEVVKDETQLFKDCAIELRWRKPTWLEVQERRIRKKLFF